MAMPPNPKNRTTAVVIWVVVAVLVVCCGGGGGLGYYFFRKMANLDVEADNYATETMIAIAKPWNADALWQRADEDLKSTVTEEHSRKLIEYYAHYLGNLKSAGPFSASSTNIRNGLTWVRVTDQSEFEKGSAHVTLTLVRHGNAWFVDGIDLVSTALPQPDLDVPTTPSSSPEPSSPPSAPEPTSGPPLG